MILNKWPLFLILPGQVLISIELAMELGENLETVCSILYYLYDFKIILYKELTQRDRNLLQDTQIVEWLAQTFTCLSRKIFLLSCLPSQAVAPLCAVCSQTGPNWTGVCKSHTAGISSVVFAWVSVFLLLVRGMESQLFRLCGKKRK